VQEKVPIQRTQIVEGPRTLRCVLVKSRPAEGPNERRAREIVAKVLGVEVERHDYGTAPRQVDALVRYPDRLAALEVVAGPDEAFNRQQDALHRNIRSKLRAFGPHGWFY